MNLRQFIAAYPNLKFGGNIHIKNMRIMRRGRKSNAVGCAVAKTISVVPSLSLLWMRSTCTITIETTNNGGSDQIIITRELEEYVAQVSMIYKRKAGTSGQQTFHY